MAALTKERQVVRRERTFEGDPVAAATKILSGGLTALDASGNLVRAAADTTLTVRGVAEGTVDNTGGAAGDEIARSRLGVHGFFNHGTDSVTRAHILKTVYVADDQTVAATDGTGTRPVAGVCTHIEGNLIFVDVGRNT